LRQLFGGFYFELIGRVEPELKPDGSIREFMPQERYAKATTTPLNPNGAGPFCLFSIAHGVNQSGVYVLTVDGTPVYAGKCVDLSKRWSGMGYGAISPKNCFAGGQSTNCKVNNRILQHSKAGQRLELWFHQTAGTSALERAVICALDPPWNSQVPW